MGTSGAYGGSPGWSGTRRDVQAWLADLANAPTSTPNEPVPQPLTPEPNAPPEGNPQVPPQPVPEPTITPSLARVLEGVTRQLARAASPASTRGGGGAGGGGGGGGISSGGTSTRRSGTATAGGIAVSGAYGARSGDAGALADAGLSFSDLEGLTPFYQAKRLVDATSGNSGLIDQSEIREVNANFMIWALGQTSAPSPVELVKAWVTEYVFRAFLTEAGSILRDGTRNGASTRNLERNVRTTLEAKVEQANIAFDGLRAADFQAAIANLLGSLARIFGESMS
jgi:hypothetical protein